MKSSVKNSKINSFSRGQVSLELLITLGIVLAFTIPVVFLLLSVSSVGFEKASKDQADATSRSLAETINNVYAQGQGSKRVLLLNAPSSTKNITIKNSASGGEVIVTIKTSQGNYEAVSPIITNAEIVGKIESKTGLFSVSVLNQGSKLVNGVPMPVGVTYYAG